MENLCFSPLSASYTLRDAHEKRIGCEREREREKLIAVENNHSQNNNYNISSLAMMMRRCWQRNYFQSLTPLTIISKQNNKNMGLKLFFV